MSILSRYKKRGFSQLLLLLESTPEDKKAKLLKLIAEENPAWEAALKSKMLTMQHLLKWPEPAWAIILKDPRPLHLSMMTGGLTDQEIETFLSFMSVKVKTQVLQHLEMKKPTPAEAWTAQTKLYADIRRLVADGSLKLAELSPELAIPEGIEDQLATGVLMLLKNQPVVDGETTVTRILSETTDSGSSQVIDLDEIKRKFSQVYQENNRLHQENQRLNAENFELRSRISQIKKIA